MQHHVLTSQTHAQECVPYWCCRITFVLFAITIIITRYWNCGAIILIELSGLMGQNVVVHHGPTNEDIVQSILTKLGITKQMTPAWVGGTWKKEDYKQWFHSRAAITIPEVRLKEAIMLHQKRQKRLHCEMTMQQHIVTLKNDNQQLQKKNKCFEQLLLEAQEQIEHLDEMHG
jgi:hypothetical protein